jgi:hypothetical protein
VVAAQPDAATVAQQQQRLNLPQPQLLNPNLTNTAQQAINQTLDNAADPTGQAVDPGKPGFTPRTFIAPTATGNAFTIASPQALATNPMMAARTAERIATTFVPVSVGGKSTTPFGVPATLTAADEAFAASPGLLGLGLDEAVPSTSNNGEPFASTVNPFSGNTVGSRPGGSAISPASLAFSGNGRGITPFGQLPTPVAFGAAPPVRGLAPGQTVVDPSLDPALAEDPAVATTSPGAPATRRRAAARTAVVTAANEHVVVPASVEEPAARARYERTAKATASTDTSTQMLNASTKSVSNQALAQAASSQLTLKLPTHMVMARNGLPSQAQQVEVAHKGNTTSHGQEHDRPKSPEEIMAEFELAKLAREEAARKARENFNTNMIQDFFAQSQVANQQLAAFAV